MEEKLGLRLQADADSWEAAFTQARAQAAGLGRVVGTATAEFNKAEEAAKKLAGIKWTDLATGLNSALDLANRLGDAIGKGIDLAKFSAEMTGLRRNVPTDALKSMTEATRGTVAQLDLLRFANKALSGEFHLTSDGLRVVTGAAQQLSERGFGPTLEVAKKLDEALRNGDFGGLKALGINATTTKEALEDFRRLAATPMNVDPTLTALKQMETGWADLANEIKRAAGNAISYLGNKALGAVGRIGTGASNRLAQSAYAAADEERARQLYIAENGGDIAENSTALAIGGYLRRASEERGLAWQRQLAGDAWAQAIELRRQQGAALTAGKGPKKGGGGGKDGGDAWGDLFLPTAHYGADIVGGGAGLLGQWSQSINGVGGALQGLGSAIGGIAGGLGGAYEAGAGGMRDRLGAQKEALAELEKEIGDKSTLLGGAYATLSSGISAAVDAAITGSDSIGKAFLKASSAALRSIATESAARAVYNTAMGFAAAANPLTAATAPGYFAAAKTFAAAAAIAGIGAAGLGAAAGGGGGASAGGPSTVPGGGNVTGGRVQTGGPQTIIVNINGTIAAGSKREVSDAVAGAVAQARRVGSARSEQSLTVRFE